MQQRLQVLDKLHCRVELIMIFWILSKSGTQNLDISHLVTKFKQKYLGRKIRSQQIIENLGRII